MRRASPSRHCWSATVVAVGIAVSLACALSIGAEASPSGTVTLSANVTSLIRIGLSTPKVVITAGERERREDHQTSTAVAVLRSASGNRMCLVYQMPETVTVRGNGVWTGTVAAQGNGRAGAAAIAAGLLRFSATLPSSYAQAIAAPALGAQPLTWAQNRARGTSLFAHYYLACTSSGSPLKPFDATVTYVAAQTGSLSSTSLAVTVGGGDDRH